MQPVLLIHDLVTGGGGLKITVQAGPSEKLARFILAPLTFLLECRSKGLCQSRRASRRGISAIDSSTEFIWSLDRSCATSVVHAMAKLDSGCHDRQCSLGCLSNENDL